MTTEIKKSTEEYLKLFNACSIGVGDTVKVVRGWKSGDYGYYDAHGIGALPLKQNFIVKSKRYDRYYLDFEGFCFCLEAPFFALELVEKAKVTTSDDSDDYLAFHNASGLKVGDSVRVVRKAEDREMGWSDIWSGHMDDFVDRTYKITGDAASYGWELDNNWTFPTFVLQKVDEPAKKEEVKYVPEEILVKENSVVVNGCELTKEQIGALHYKLFRKGKKRVKKT